MYIDTIKDYIFLKEQTIHHLLKTPHSSTYFLLQYKLKYEIKMQDIQF